MHLPLPGGQFHEGVTVEDAEWRFSIAWRPLAFQAGPERRQQQTSDSEHTVRHGRKMIHHWSYEVFRQIGVGHKHSARSVGVERDDRTWSWIL